MCASACSAQDAAIKAPVNVYFTIYRGCVAGLLKDQNYPTKRKDVQQYVDNLDQTCEEWAHAWFPVINDVGRKGLTVDEDLRYNERKKQVLIQLKLDLDTLAGR